MNIKYLPYHLIGTLVLLEILSIISTDSMWPWGIVSHESLALRIVGWILIVQLCFGLLFCLVLRMVPDRPCPICYKDLKSFISVYGAPCICPKCRTIFHDKCFKSKPRCPVCYPDTDAEADIPLDFRSEFLPD